MARRILLFQRVNPWHLPLIGIYRLLGGRIGYWRADRVSDRRLRGLVKLDPSDFFTYPEWVSVQSDAADYWKSASTSIVASLARVTFGSKSVDFHLILLQWLAISVEDEFLFHRLCERWAKAQQDETSPYIASTFFEVLRRSLSLPNLPSSDVPRSRLGRSAETLWQWTLASLQAAKVSLQLFRPSLPESLRYETIWSSVTSGELATGPGQLDVTFLLQQNLIRPEEVLFVLASAPSAAASSWLAKQGARWILSSDVARLSGPRGRFFALLIEAQLGFSIGLRRLSGLSPILLQFSLQALPWELLCRHKPPRVFLTSTSSAWPEIPAVAVMNAHEVRSVFWHYSTNLFPFAPAEFPFRGRRVYGSVVASREVWAWNPSVCEGYTDGFVLPAASNPKFRTIGPLMCGSSQILTLSPREARARFGISESEGARFVTVFDIPTATREMHRRHGLGPSAYPVELLDRFFGDVRAVLDRYPHFKVILKPKRNLKDPQREYCESMWTLLDPKGPYVLSGRVILLENSIDPYVPVAIADYCLGLTFTSPVLVGLWSGRPSLFHDPLAQAHQYRIHSMEPLITRSTEELLGMLMKFDQNGMSALQLEQNPQASQDFLSPRGDPAALFAQALRSS